MDEAAGEIDVDLVVHGVGAASTWAKRVEPGEPVQIAGPKSSAGHPAGVDWTLVAGDETALPAIGRWLEHWPTGARGQVFIEVADDAHRQDLPVPDGVEVSWLSRDGAEAGTTTLLFDAVRSADWWPGTVFAWVAGETLTLAPIRRWLRNDRGLPKEQVEVTGYWRRQSVVVSAGDRETPDLDAGGDLGEAFHELTELAPAFALRVAATIGLAAAFDGGPRTGDELAGRTGADADGVRKLVRYLASIGVTERCPDGRYALTELGRELEDDERADELRLDGVHAGRELAALLALAAAVRTGRGDDAERNGRTFDERALDDPGLVAERVEAESEFAVYPAGPLASHPALDGAREIVIGGPGAGAFAETVVGAHAAARVRLVGAPSELAALARIHPADPRLVHEPGSLLARRDEPADVVVLGDALTALPDVDAVHLLRCARESLRPGGRVVLVTRVLDPDTASEHDYEDDLAAFALSGGGRRDDAEHRALVREAGLDVTDRRMVGWGDSAYTLHAAP